MVIPSSSDVVCHVSCATTLAWCSSACPYGIGQLPPDQRTWPGTLMPVVPDTQPQLCSVWKCGGGRHSNRDPLNWGPQYQSPGELTHSISRLVCMQNFSKPHFQTNHTCICCTVLNYFQAQCVVCVHSTQYTHKYILSRHECMCPHGPGMWKLPGPNT